MIETALAVAFVGGVLARLAGLPALVGFLLAGFILRVAGFEPDDALEGVAHAGVLVLLFSVGLKFRLQTLASAEVLCGALLQILVFSFLLAIVLVLGATMPIPVALLVAVALSMSSTVVAAKVLEEKRELRAFHGRVAIGILA